MRRLTRRRLPALTVTIALVFSGGLRIAAGDKAKVSTLASCPAWGAETRDTPRGLLNEVKHRVPAQTTPLLLELRDFVALQQQSAARVQTGKDAPIHARERARLRDFIVRDQHASEGDLVALSGFVLKAEVNVGESVNCYLHGLANNDFHIGVGDTPQAPPRESLVAEMIPQGRQKLWTLGRLRRIAAERRRVMVIGQLMLDSIHKPGDEARASLWEVHPVTMFLVCAATESGCDPGVEGQWRPLESLEER
jgi:hypothetical protein